MPIKLIDDYSKYKAVFRGSYWMEDSPGFYMGYLNSNGLEIAYLSIELAQRKLEVTINDKITFTTWQIGYGRQNDIYRFAK